MFSGDAMLNTIVNLPLVTARAGAVNAAVAVQRLSHVFGEGVARRQVLFDLDLTIGRGEIVILMGPSGCGKTTLLTLVGALREPQSGSVRTLGQELNGADRKAQIAVRRRIGFIYQSHNLHESMTAFENVRMGLEVQGPAAMLNARQRCAEMLAAVGLSDKLDAYPAKLSGGQKQRVAIARALVSKPDLVLADEPTSALDKATGRQIVDHLHELAKDQGSAILMVTHDNRILDIADRILEMEDGRIISESRGAASNDGR
jgi:putative ABC transport system ATP-binding protein